MRLWRKPKKPVLTPVRPEPLSIHGFALSIDKPADLSVYDGEEPDVFRTAAAVSAAQQNSVGCREVVFPIGPVAVGKDDRVYTFYPKTAKLMDTFGVPFQFSLTKFTEDFQGSGPLMFTIASRSRMRQFRDHLNVFVEKYVQDGFKVSHSDGVMRVMVVKNSAFTTNFLLGPYLNVLLDVATNETGSISSNEKAMLQQAGWVAS